MDYYKMKLKTLKDIFERIRELVKRDKILLALIDKIEQQEKQEAIKWVKVKGVMREFTFKAWIEFFNITEEDLNSQSDIKQLNEGERANE